MFISLAQLCQAVGIREFHCNIKRLSQTFDFCKFRFGLI